MRLYGLTGGIASGKSLAARCFRGLGVPVIDADLVARELTALGQPALGEIAARWPGVLRPDGQLDRSALGARVFAEAAERQALEAILHPRIGAEVRRRAAALAALGHRYALYEAALIFEGRGERDLDGVILVSASGASQRARLVARDGLTPPAIEARLLAQLPLDTKRARAQWILENDGSEVELLAQVGALNAVLKASSP